ncbi:unnamed protein product [marine sediment metagenome]|uniref:Uncharacterized protein n=1 Tax=marine sediment metagenome TaxID=412755 RepID=X1ESA6_9ZZZZ
MIFSTSTRTGENLEESLKYLVNLIYDNYSSLLTVLKNFETNIEGLAEKLEKNPVEMRDLLNNLEIKRFIEVDRLARTYKVRHGLKLLL